MFMIYARIKIGNIEILKAFITFTANNVEH